MKRMVRATIFSVEYSSSSTENTSFARSITAVNKIYRQMVKETCTMLQFLKITIRTDDHILLFENPPIFTTTKELLNMPSPLPPCVIPAVLISQT
jgi:hypothetical protein